MAAAKSANKKLAAKTKTKAVRTSPKATLVKRSLARARSKQVHLLTYLFTALSIIFLIVVILAYGK